MRKAAAQAAKEAVEPLPKTEIASLQGYDRHEYSGRSSGDSRNGNCQRTIQTSLGPITIDVPRGRNGRYEPIAIPKYKRKTDPIVSTALKLYSSGTADEEMRFIVSPIYEANCSKSTISSITDAVSEDVKRFSERILPTAFSPSSSTPPAFPLGGIRSRRRPSTWPSGRPTTARPWPSAARSRPRNRRSPIRGFCPASSQGARKASRSPSRTA